MRKFIDDPLRQYRTEAGVAKNREVMMLMSGAWKTLAESDLLHYK